MPCTNVAHLVEASICSFCAAEIYYVETAWAMTADGKTDYFAKRSLDTALQD